MDSPLVDRRCALVAIAGAAGAPLVLHTPDVRAQIRTDTLTVLYRPATSGAPTRLDPAVQAALLALEEEFLARGLKVLQPRPEVYALMDKGPGVVVTFADDSGFCAVFSAYRNLRPQPGQEAGTAEVRLQMRVFVGRHTLVAHEGRGQMFTRLDPASREFGERRAMELAARRAAADVAEKTATRLKELTPAQINELIRQAPSPSTVVAEVALPELAAPPPPPAPPAPPAPAPLAPPPAAAAPPAMPALSPAPSPAPAPATATPSLAPVRNRYALLVGVSDYPSLKGPARQQSKLPGVRKDIENMQRALANMGWDPKSVVSLLDDKASGAMVRGVLKIFQRQVSKDDLVLVFVSGHGAPKEYSLSGFGRPILADDTGEDDPSTLDFWELQSLVRNLSCDRAVFIIDTCHAGGAASKLQTVEVTANGVSAGAAPAGPNGASMARLGDPNKHLAIITASRADEVSGDTANGGVFTLTFLDGLQRTKGAEPLGRVVAQHVAPTVVQFSRENCKRQGSGCKFPQQTPELHHTGRGDQIVL